MSLGFWMVSSQIWSRHFWLAIFGRAHIWSNPYLVLTHIWSKPIFGRGHIWTNQIWSVPYLVHPNLVCAEFGARIRGPLARGPYHKGPFLKDLWSKGPPIKKTDCVTQAQSSQPILLLMLFLIFTILFCNFIMH